MATFRLSDLSSELVVLIAEQLDDRSLFWISATSRYYHALTDPVRFKRGATSVSSRLLFWAARHGRLNVVQRLIDYGADINRKDESAFLPPEHFQYLVNPRDIEMKVSGRVSRPSVLPREHWTALHLAAAEGHVDIVDLLLKSGADLEAGALRPHDCGHSSALYGHYTVHTPFSGFNPCWTPLHYAICKGRGAVIQRLIDANASLTQPYFTALHFAAAHGTLETVRTILEAAPELLSQGDHRGYTSMALAYHRQRSDDIMSYLIQKVVESDAPMRRLLLEREPSLLLYACDSKAYHNVVKLVGLGANVHHRDPRSSTTALHICCAEDLSVAGSNLDIDRLQLEEYRLRAVRALLEAGADIDARDGYDRTPLHCAARISAVPVAFALVEFGARPSSCGRHSFLSEIVRADTRPSRDDWDNQIRLFNYFVEAGADINFQDDHKITVVHLLCKFVGKIIASNNAHIKRSIDHIKVLVDTGRVDHSLKDNDEKRAVDYVWYRPDLFNLFPNYELRQVLTTSDLINIRDATTRGAWTPYCGLGVMSVLENLDKIDSHFVYDNAETLYSVILGGFQDIALQLLDRGAVTSYVSTAGENLLHVACRSRLDKVMQRLLEMGFHTDQVTKTGDTPLSLYVDAALKLSIRGMANWEKYAAVPFIVRHGGDPHRITCSLPTKRLDDDYKWQQRPLDQLISRGEHVMARKILELCPPPQLPKDELNTSGYSYLHRACSFAHKVPDRDFVRYLLSLEHLDVNAKNAYGRTVLSEVIKSMTPAKPWVSPFYQPQENHSGLFGFVSQLYSPLAHASNFLECVKLLENHGADWSIKCTSINDFGEEVEISPAAELKQILHWDLDEDDEANRMGLDIIESELLDLEWNPEEMDASRSPFIRGTDE